MSKNLTLAALVVALFAMGPAMAQDTGKTKAEVKKEAQAAARSTAGKGEADCAPITEKSVKSRAAVRAEGQAAMKTGEGKEEFGCPSLTTKSTKSRTAVKTEAAKAVKAGETGGGEADVKK